jgi:Ca2+-binding RTX toxin-like protein
MSANWRAISVQNWELLLETPRQLYINAGSAITMNLATGTGQATGGAGTDTISNFEHLTGSAYNDTLTGNSAANIIEGGAGNDTIDAAGGSDTVSYAVATDAVTVNLATTGTGQNTGGAGTDTLSNFENLLGSAFNDTLTGSSADNVIEGALGNDSIDGAGGSDTVSYASAASAVVVNLSTLTAQNTGGAGTDTISNTENVLGSAYNDTLTGDASANIIEGGLGNDAIDGGGGSNDIVSYAAATAGVTVNLATLTGQNTVNAGTDTISNMEGILGSAFADTLTGDNADNVIEGGLGNDSLNGRGGNDTLSYRNATAGITMNLATAAGQNTGGAGTDTVSNFEHLAGSAFPDTLTGNGSDNIIEGGCR